MFGLLLESPPRDDSNKWSNIGIGEEIGIIDIKYTLYLESWQQFNYTQVFFIILSHLLVQDDQHMQHSVTVAVL